MIFFENGKLTVRSLEHHDKNIIVKWFSDNEVLQYYEGRNCPQNEDMVEKNFYSEYINKTRCIIEYSQNPIGYIQFYPINEEERKAYGYANFQGSIYGTDQFIGETEYWGQGIGKTLMKSIADFLIKKREVKKIVLDPQTWNQRAIKCYEKSGFIKVKLLSRHELHEGELRDCWLMEFTGKAIDDRGGDLDESNICINSK